MALLAQCGLSPARLSLIAGRALHDRVHPDIVAVAHGLVTHARLMEALAQVLRCRYAPDIESLEIRPDMVAFRTGVVRIANTPGLEVLAAPTGAHLAQLLLRRAVARPWLVLTARDILRNRLRRDLASDIAKRAAAAPRQRATRPMPDAELIDRRIIAAAIIAGLLVGACIICWPGPMLVAIAALLSPLFYMKVVMHLTAALIPSASPAPIRLLGDDHLPHCAVIIPLYREAKVIGQLLQALEAIDYPRSKLQVLIVLEEDDAETGAALAQARIAPWIDILRAPPGMPRTKPRALNVALDQCDAEIVSIFDAEDLPAPDQLRMAATVLMRGPRDIGAVQAALRVDNVDDSLISRLFALEYATLFEQFNPLLDSCDLPFLLGGTSNHFRRRDLIEIGGWDAHNLTEDAEIGIRLCRRGLKLRTIATTTQEEAPVTYRSWRKQRVRWMKGFMQTLWGLVRQPVLHWHELKPEAALVTLLLVGGTVISALCLPFAWAGLALVAVTEPWPASNTLLQALLYGGGLTLFISGFAALILPPALAGCRAGIPRAQHHALLMPLYALAISAAAWIAVIELVRRPHYWDKTEHGLSRSRRKRLDVGGNQARRPLDVEQAAALSRSIDHVNRGRMIVDVALPRGHLSRNYAKPPDDSVDLRP